MREKMLRFNEYMKYRGLNDNQVTIECGLSQGLLGQARTGKSDIGTSTVAKILKTYQDISRVWLLTGEGDMLQQPSAEATPTTDADQAVSHVPLLPLSAHGGRLNDFVTAIREIDCEKVTSPIRGADFAMPVCGDSMAPEYPSGSRILVKRIDERAFINWGHVHVLDTCNGTVIKKLFPSPQHPDRVLCRSINPDYPDFEVSFKDIYGVYRVLLCMSIK